MPASLTRIPTCPHAYLTICFLTHFSLSSLPLNKTFTCILHNRRYLFLPVTLPTYLLSCSSTCFFLTHLPTELNHPSIDFPFYLNETDYLAPHSPIYSPANVSIYRSSYLSPVNDSPFHLFMIRMFAHLMYLRERPTTRLYFIAYLLAILYIYLLI